MKTEIESPENSGKIQAKGKYKKGYSGNPRGKPKGARNKSTLAAEALLGGSLEKICKKVEEEALNGNMQAAKMILERFLPLVILRRASPLMLWLYTAQKWQIKFLHSR